MVSRGSQVLQQVGRAKVAFNRWHEMILLQITEKHQALYEQGKLVSPEITVL